MSKTFTMTRASLVALSALSVGMLHCAFDPDASELEGDDGHPDAPVSGDVGDVDDDYQGVTAASTATFTAASDAEVAQATPNTALGTSTSLGSDGSPARHSYFRFAVSGLTSTVKSAKLRCYATNGSGNGPSVYSTTFWWNEGTITWNNKPAASGPALADVGAVSANSWIEFDVTSAVKSGNGNYSFVMAPTSDDSVICNSREAASNRPQLVITLNPTSTTDAGAADSGTLDSGTTVDSGTGSTGSIACPAGNAEVFRDDFNGTALDKTKWQVIEQNSGGGGLFTQLTKMLANNVTVTGGRLHIASKRHCIDPYADKSSPEHAAKCAGTNYYSGGWIKGTTGYAPGKGLMVFHAKMPAPVQGMFPGIWARNTESGSFYGELDLIETWWDFSGKGKASDPNLYASTTWMGTNAQFHSSSNNVGPFANLVTALHVWEVEWDATAATPAIKYFYRDAPGATRVLTKTVTASTAGLSGNVSAADFKQILTYGFRPYVDFAVQPDSSWHVGPDTAAVYDPQDLEVESVIVCKQ